MAAWTAAAQGRFRFERISDERAAHVRVRFADGDTHFGEASPLTDRTTGFIVSAEVAIASNLVADALDQRIIIYMTALHELGHVLGLKHTSEFDDIMYLFRRPDDAGRYFGAYRRKLRSAKDIGSPSATGLSPHDVELLRTLYDR